MARRYLKLSAEEWAGLSWAVQQAYMEGFYTEGLLERPAPAMDGDMSVPDDVRSLTAEGTGYRSVEAPAFDLEGLIGEMEKRRLGEVRHQRDDRPDHDAQQAEPEQGAEHEPGREALPPAPQSRPVVIMHPALPGSAL